MDGFRIEKQGYSSNPWRVVWPDGTNLTRLKLIETETTKAVLPTPVAGDTKTEAIAELGRFAYDLHQRLTELIREAQDG